MAQQKLPRLDGNEGTVLPAVGRSRSTTRARSRSPRPSLRTTSTARLGCSGGACETTITNRFVQYHDHGIIIRCQLLSLMSGPSLTDACQEQPAAHATCYCVPLASSIQRSPSCDPIPTVCRESVASRSDSVAARSTLLGASNYNLKPNTLMDNGPVFVCS